MHMPMSMPQDVESANNANYALEGDAQENACIDWFMEYLDGNISLEDFLCTVEGPHALSRPQAVHTHEINPEGCNIPQVSAPVTCTKDFKSTGGDTPGDTPPGSCTSPVAPNMSIGIVNNCERFPDGMDVRREKDCMEDCPPSMQSDPPLNYGIPPNISGQGNFGSAPPKDPKSPPRGLNPQDTLGTKSSWENLWVHESKDCTLPQAQRISPNMECLSPHSNSAMGDSENRPGHNLFPQDRESIWGGRKCWEPASTGEEIPEARRAACVQPQADRPGVKENSTVQAWFPCRRRG